MPQTRIALIGIVVEDFSAADRINDLLHAYRAYIIGRMGLPYARRNVGVISVALDAPQDVVSALSGKLGRLPGVTSKTVSSKAFGDEDADAT